MCDLTAARQDENPPPEEPDFEALGQALLDTLVLPANLWRYTHEERRAAMVAVDAWNRAKQWKEDHA